VLRPVGSAVSEPALGSAVHATNPAVMRREGPHD